MDTLEVILGAYREFSGRMELMLNRKLSKPERVRTLFDNTLQRLTKRMILEKCPDISESTVELALAALLKPSPPAPPPPVGGRGKVGDSGRTPQEPEGVPRAEFMRHRKPHMLSTYHTGDS